MDGATLWKEFRYVVMPLSVGGLASCGLLCLVLSWNEAFWALNLTSAKAGDLETAATNASGSIASVEDIGAAMQAIGPTCMACHREYRE